MKVKRNGEVKLGKGDFRVGNFVVHLERSHVKIEDVGGFMSVRLAAHSHAGMMVRAAIASRVRGEDDGEKFLQNLCAVTFNYVGCIPDLEFLSAVNDACLACVERHKDLYAQTDSEETILQEEREREEAEDAARKEVGV